MVNIKFSDGLYSKIRLFLKLPEVKYACISILLYTILILIISPPWRILMFDEVNYFNASKMGILSNAFDSACHNSSIPSFSLGSTIIFM